MEKRTVELISEYDSLSLSVLWIVPDEEIKGVVQIAHGMSEHKERYLPFMEFLAEHGYASVINDHRGHGKSVRDKSELGYFYNGKNLCCGKGFASGYNLGQKTVSGKEIFPSRT